jgi:membrane-bound serine protease (ClpP class)
MNGSDAEMEAMLERLARRCPTPPLPAETSALAWTVQVESDRAPLARVLGALRNAAMGVGRVSLAVARVTAVVAISGAFLLIATTIRSSGSGSNMMQPAITPGPTGSPSPSGSATPSSGRQVIVLPTSGVVDDVMADYVTGGIRRAEADGAAAVIVQLDTLGGSEEAMNRIVHALDAKVPTIVWVGPSGAKAASAGSFIAMAANFAYMAPGTNIGAASPVSSSGGDIASEYGQTEATKVLQDAMAEMRSLAQASHPAAEEWAVTMVEQARSYSAEEAFAAQGINGVAANLNQVLTAADGQTVTVNGSQVVVHTQGATIVTVNEDLIQSFLHALDDPNIAFILLVVGVLCVMVEFFQPTILIGLLGALSLALSFYGSGSLPLNVLGVILVVLGIAMLALEPAIPSHGLLTLGGVVCFIVGAVAFYGSPGPYLPGVSVAWPIIATMAALAGAYGFVIVRSVMEMRRAPIPVGSGMVGTDDLVGMVAEVRSELAPTGTVYVGRESWTAREKSGQSVAPGARVKVVKQEGLTLIVEKVD